MIAEFITSYTSEQNNVTEQTNWTLLTIVRALLFDSGLSKSFWHYAAHTAVYIKNHIIKIRDHPGKTSHELWTSKSLKLSNMRVWKKECWIHLSNEKNKLNSRVKKEIFINYIKEFNQYLMLLSDTDWSTIWSDQSEINSDQN